MKTPPRQFDAAASEQLHRLLLAGFLALGRVGEK